MKNLALLLLLVKVSIFSSAQEAVISVQAFHFDLTNKIPSSIFDPKTIGNSLGGSVCSNLMYHANGVDHIVNILGGDKPGPGIHFIKKNGKWEFENYYTDVLMDGARSYSFFDTNGNFAYSNHGSESIFPWPLGEVVSVNTIGEKLKWKKVSLHRAHYDNLSCGDLNNDGLSDIAAMHMGTDGKGWYGVAGILTYTQNSDGNFVENRDIISDPSQWGDNTWPGTHHNGAVLIADIMGDKRPEIMTADYGFNPSSPSDRYSIAIFKYNESIKKYQFSKTPTQLGVFSNLSQGATSMKSADLNNDGLNDIVVATEGNLPNGRSGGIVQIWYNKGNGDLKPDQAIVCDADSIGFREFELADVNDDNKIDIILHAGGGELVIGKPPYNDGFFTNLKYSIWLNRGQYFSTISNDLKLSKFTLPTGISPQTTALKGFYINNKLRFFGYNRNCTDKSCNVDTTNGFFLYDATISFCNKIVKPTFNTSKYSFCTGDSLKLSVTNVNKGDTLKWYFGSKSDLLNVSNKTFTDSTKLYVTRTDSVGCIISSDTIQINKFSIPSAPSLSRDTSNNLVANINGLTWYKDGTKITDTTQKIKPTSNGYYTATSTQNGCTSALSTSYYYLTTAISYLSYDEYFKISPNPTSGDIYLNYNIRSFKDIYINIIDVAGRSIIRNKKVSNGSKISLGSSVKGNYIIQVKDKTGRLLVTEKVIKN